MKCRCIKELSNYKKGEIYEYNLRDYGCEAKVYFKIFYSDQCVEQYSTYTAFTMNIEWFYKHFIDIQEDRDKKLDKILK